MTALVRVPTPLLGTIEDFFEACSASRWYVDQGWASKQVAVDSLQFLAEQAGYVDAYGQDAVQSLMADAFAPQIDMQTDYAAQLVRRWELDDPRDRWKLTGELPPAPHNEPGPRPRPAPQSTLDAFNFVLGTGDAERLRKWLRDHSDVAHAMVAEVAAC